MISNTMPSRRFNVLYLMPGTMLSLAMSMTNSDAKMTKGMSRRRCKRSMENGMIMAVAPKMSNTLAILEPSTLPIAMSPLSLSADDTEMNNSGALVPMPTMVKPMMKLEILARWAMATDESTR